MSTEPCPVHGCDRTKDKRYLMCGMHWSWVPKPIREEIYMLIEDWDAETDSKKRRAIHQQWLELTSDIIWKLGGRYATDHVEAERP